MHKTLVKKNYYNFPYSGEMYIIFSRIYINLSSEKDLLISIERVSYLVHSNNSVSYTHLTLPTICSV